jgi:FAD/FMN-containing dehydrogenase
VQLQQIFDAGLPPGVFNYWTANFLQQLSDDVIDVLVDAFAQRPTPLCVLVLETLGGAVGRVPEHETAFTLRGGDYNLAIVGRWTDPADAARTTAWTRQLHERLLPHSLEAGYVNYLPEDDANRVAAVYGAERYRRLRELKRVYDPDNVFRMNLNIAPAH